MLFVEPCSLLPLPLVSLLFVDEGSERKQQFVLNVEQVIFPAENALIAGQTRLDKAARCYCRYKFYDRGEDISIQAPYLS